MRTAIIQPNYIPWRGYFDFFKICDTFVFYDDVQYTKGDWRNRNLIKTQDGAQWLTIPVHASGRLAKNLLIKDTKMVDNGWRERHLKTIEANYGHAPYFGEVYDIMRDAFEIDSESICDLSIDIIKRILDYLGIRCRLLLSSKIGYSELKKTDRLVAICKHLSATEYMSGDAARDYLEVDKFGDIRVLWHKYKEKVYPQLWGEFMSRVSIIDLLCNCGMKGYDII